MPTTVPAVTATGVKPGGSATRGPPSSGIRKPTWFDRAAVMAQMRPPPATTSSASAGRATPLAEPFGRMRINRARAGGVEQWTVRA
jgi:hypothetical protein